MRNSSTAEKYSFKDKKKDMLMCARILYQREICLQCMPTVQYYYLHIISVADPTRFDFGV